MDIQLIVGRFTPAGIRPWLLPLLLLATPAEADLLATKAIDLRATPSLQQIVPALAERRVVFVGESHDQYSHHLIQLAIVRALHERHPNLAIGMEQFQQPFQSALDDYVAGRIDEESLLRRSEYLERWRFDWRLYRPILQFAREQQIPVIALNVPKELTAKVAAGGIDALSPEEKSKLPELDRSNDRYRARIKSAFDAHPVREGKGFDHFLEAQLLWDEGMAARAADYLKANPQRPMVILAGSGHVAYRDGIPRRLERRLKTASAVVVNDPMEELSPDLADFILMPAAEKLPPRGMMGVSMEPAAHGVRVAGFGEQSAARAAGIEKGDRIVTVDGRPTATPNDVTLLMMDRKPGETVDVTVSRSTWTGEKQLRYSVQLH